MGLIFFSRSAGRDTEARGGGGTWMGVSTDGKLATLTNVLVKNHRKKKATVQSRGIILCLSF